MPLFSFVALGVVVVGAVLVLHHQGHEREVFADIGERVRAMKTLLAQTSEMTDDEAVEHYLVHMRKNHWWFFCYGVDKDHLTEIAIVHPWSEHADVVILRGPHDAIAYRAVITGRDGCSADPLRPEYVTWSYEKSAARYALAGVLSLDVPGADSEATPFRMPQGFGVSPDRKPFSVSQGDNHHSIPPPRARAWRSPIMLRKIHG